MSEKFSTNNQQEENVRSNANWRNDTYGESLSQTSTAASEILDVFKEQMYDCEIEDDIYREDFANESDMLEDAKSELSRLHYNGKMEKIIDNPASAAYGLVALARLNGLQLGNEDTDGIVIDEDDKNMRKKIYGVYESIFSKVFSDVECPELSIKNYMRLNAEMMGDDDNEILSENLNVNSLETEPDKVLEDAKNTMDVSARNNYNIALISGYLDSISGRVSDDEVEHTKQEVVDNLKSQYQMNMFIRNLEQKIANDKETKKLGYKIIMADKAIND